MFSPLRWETDTWSEKASMETPRGWHCSATLGGKVYVVGGSQLGPSGERVDVLSVEVFSPESGVWSRAAPLPLGVSTAGLSPLAEKLYLLGGWNEAEKRYKAAVQKYDPATDSWSMAEDLPEPTAGGQGQRAARHSHSGLGQILSHGPAVCSRVVLLDRRLVALLRLVPASWSMAEDLP